MNDSVDARTPGEWRLGWRTLLGAAIGYSAALCHVYALGLFIAPLEAEFGWNRAEISSGLTIFSVVVLFVAPFVGTLLDRYGARRVALPGLLFYLTAFAALSVTGSAVWQWWALWVMLGIAGACVQAAVWTKAVVALFDRSRGLALAITLCGGGLSSAFSPSLAQFFIAELGWRLALVAVPATFAVISLPILVFFFKDGEREVSGGNATRSGAGSTWRDSGVRADILGSRFLRLAFLSLAVMIATTAVLVHFVPILIAKGLSAQTAAALAGIIGIGSIAGRLVGGFMLDRFSGPFVGAVVFGCAAVATALLLLIEVNYVSGFVIALVFGLALGGEVDVIAYLTTRYYRLQNFGVLFSVLASLQILATGIGPLVAGLAFDRFGNYDTLLLVLLPIYALSILIVATLGAYKRPTAAITSHRGAG